MRRLLILFATFALTWFATGHIAQSADAAYFVLRDSLLLALFSAAIFALVSVWPSGLSPLTLPLILPALTFLLAVALRLWQLTTLPSDCLGEECTRALQLAEGGGTGLVTWLATLFWRITEDGVFSLRLSSALIGSLALMAFYGMASQLVTPGSALIGTLLLAINPWHLWLSRSGDLTVGTALTVTLLLWPLLALVNRRERWRWGALLLVTLAFVFELFAIQNVQFSNATLRSLLHSDLNNLASPFSDLPLLAPVVSALAICGLWVATRNGKRPQSALLIGMSVLAGLAIHFSFAPTALLLPLIFLLATVAFDQLWNALVQSWQPLIQPQTLFASALLAVLVIGGRGTSNLLTQLEQLRMTEANAVNGAIARYLLDASRAAPEIIFFTPPALRFDPAARLLLGERLQSAQVRVIDPAKLPLNETTTGDLLFLLPSDQIDLLTLLQQLYPLAQLEPQISDEGVTAFTVLRISPNALAAQQPLPFFGLTGTYYAGEQVQGMTLAQQLDPLPGYPPDLPAPYSVLWSGKLAAARSGEYLLGILAEGTLGMIIDGTQLISGIRDPADGENALSALHEGTLYLEQGWHSIEIRYTPAVPFAPLKLYWQPPGSGPLPLRSEFLHPSPDPLEQPQIYGNMLPLVDERLGMVDGFALTSSVDLWQSLPQSGISNLPALVAEPVWQNAAGCGAGDGQLNRPHGATFDLSRSQILVADTDNRRIVAYSLAGQLQQAYTGEMFQEPVDVAVEPSGTLLALDAMINGIFRIDPTTSAVSPFPTNTSFYRPRGFAVDPLGMILVADTGGARVVVLNESGQLSGEFGGLDKALGKGQPADAMALNNIWWAISAENGRIWNLATLGSLGALSYNNTIDGPQMAALPNGSFFVSDPSQQRILYFAFTGQPLRQLSGQHAVPTGIAAAVIEGQTYLAVVDSAACSLTLWRVVEL